MTRFQTGWLRRRKRPKLGDVWVFCYRRRRPHDGKWVEATPIVVGPIQDLASKEAAWRRVKELQLNPNRQSASTQMTFGELALHYAQHDLLNDQHEVVPEETHLTILKCRGYRDTWILPRWERVVALAVIPSEVEKWLKEIKRDHHIENRTLSEIRKIMDLVYRHGQRFGLLPHSNEGNPILLVRRPVNAAWILSARY